jgi:hypothetical protein
MLSSKRPLTLPYISEKVVLVKISPGRKEIIL